jgi:glycosyltransferase involved in cell wall biosynthesis
MEKIKSLSIIIPTFNEAKTLPLLLDRISCVTLIDDIKKELILVNDCSTDDTDSVLEKYLFDNPGKNIHFYSHTINKGKGAALHTGISKATGDFIMIQDADLEYDPEEINDLLKPVLRGSADVVFGSRFLGGKSHRILYFWHSLGNKFLTTLSNMFTNLNLTDMETGYKLLRSSVIQKIELKEKRFGFEPEITAKISRIPKIRIYEVGISYYGRTYEEGKKINWKDGIWAIFCIFKYNLFSK